MIPPRTLQVLLTRLEYTHAFYATLPLWKALLWSTLALTMEGKVHTPRKR